MKRKERFLNFQPLVILIFLCFFSINCFLFGKSLLLTEEILKLEKEIKRIQLENSVLERELFEITSLETISNFASFLGFTKEAEPLYLDDLKYAYR